MPFSKWCRSVHAADIDLKQCNLRFRLRQFFILFLHIMEACPVKKSSQKYSALSSPVPAFLWVRPRSGWEQYHYANPKLWRHCVKDVLARKVFIRIIIVDNFDLAVQKQPTKPLQSKKFNSPFPFSLFFIIDSTEHVRTSENYLNVR